MARQRNPMRDEAYRMWIESDKKRPLKDIAEELGVSASTVRKWKSQDNWERSDSKESAPIKKERSVTVNDPPKLVIENDELTEQQKLFCLYYLQSFNATKAYQQAYGCDYQSAKTAGNRLLTNVHIKQELHRLKAELQQDLFVDVKDLMMEYIKQAFADITDYVDFGTKKEIETVVTENMVASEEIDENGMPIMENEKKQVEFEYSFVNLKDSKEVDGTMIQEVKKGKDGVSVKLYDKQKAMSELMKYLGGDELRNAQISKMNQADANEQTTEDKLDELLSKIEGELDGSN